MKQKDIPTLLQAAEILARENPRFRLLMVGTGPDEEMLHRLGGEHVVWLGRRDDVPALLRACDFLVLPSLWEGMPNVVLEAMASRRAVIATQVEGNDELVIPGETGWLVPPGDAQALAGAMREALADRERLQAMGAAGRERVERAYSLARVVAAYDEAWIKLIT